MVLAVGLRFVWPWRVRGWPRQREPFLRAVDRWARTPPTPFVFLSYGSIINCGQYLPNFTALGKISCEALPAPAWE